MKKYWVPAIFLSFLLCGSLKAQSVKRDREDKQNLKYDWGATYDNSQAKTKRKQKKEGAYTRQFDQKVQEYYARMEEDAKKYRKMDKEMKKPQFSNPTYFGHKHPPKKRPPGKKKYCKVCGMWH